MRKLFSVVLAIAVLSSVASAGVVKFSAKKSYQASKFAIRESRTGVKAAEKASVFSAKKLAKAGKAAKLVLY